MMGVQKGLEWGNEHVMGIAQVICMKVECCSGECQCWACQVDVWVQWACHGCCPSYLHEACMLQWTNGCCDMPARGRPVAVCWLGIGGVVATLCGLLYECRRVCIGTALWLCVRQDRWMVFLKRQRYVLDGFQVKVENCWILTCHPPISLAISWLKSLTS